MAKIDVLLPVKNGIDFLAASLDSVIAQTFQDWRLIVLDHGSTDGSREMAEAYQARDRRIEVHAFPQAHGLSGLLNCGLDIADCDYVMRHDADDVCVPERMAVALAAFEAQPDCIALGGSADMIDAAGAPIGVMSMSTGRERLSVGGLFHNPIAHPTAMLRFEPVKRMGVRYGVDFLKVLPENKSLQVNALAEDYFLFGQLAILGKCANVPQKLIRYRSHGNNVSAKRFFEQMEVSLSISRFLARSFCVMHDLTWFDPAPFCNHGGLLLNVDGRGDFDVEFARMVSSLERGLGDSPGLRRELAFRRVLATRQPAQLLWRYYRFQADNVPETGEWNAVRSWLVGRFPGKRRMRVAAELSA